MPDLNEKSREAIYAAGEVGYDFFKKVMRDAKHPAADKMVGWDELEPVVQGAWAVAILRGAEPLMRRDMKDMLLDIVEQFKKMADDLGNTDDLKPKTF